MSIRGFHQAADCFAALFTATSAAPFPALTGVVQLPFGPRSAIVNVEHIKELHPMFHGEYVVVLRNGTRLTLTRGYREKLQQLGLS